MSGRTHLDNADDDVTGGDVIAVKAPVLDTHDSESGLTGCVAETGVVRDRGPRGPRGQRTAWYTRHASLTFTQRLVCGACACACFCMAGRVTRYNKAVFSFRNNTCNIDEADYHRGQREVQRRIWRGQDILLAPPAPSGISQHSSMWGSGEGGQ